MPLGSRRISLLLGALSTLGRTLAWTKFTVPHNAGRDDTPGLMQVLSSGNLTSNATILFQRGITYNIFTPVKFPTLHNVEVAIEGNLTYPNDIATVQGKFITIGLETMPANPWYSGCCIISTCIMRIAHTSDIYSVITCRAILVHGKRVCQSARSVADGL